MKFLRLFSVRWDFKTEELGIINGIFLLVKIFDGGNTKTITVARKSLHPDASSSDVL